MQAKGMNDTFEQVLEDLKKRDNQDMNRPVEPLRVYRPDGEAHRVYDRLYGEYLRLHDLFGRGGLDTMKVLKDIQKKAYRQS